MCRSTTENGGLQFLPRGRDRLRIRAFYVGLSDAAARKRRPLPESLTLVYLPRICGTPLEINGAKVRADTPAFVVLHRVRSAEALFANTDRVRAAEGVRVEIYIGAEKLLKGTLRRSVGGIDGGGEGERREMECRVVGESDGAAIGVAAAEVCVVAERGVLMREKVEMAVAGRARRRRRFCLKLQEIPEEGEGEACDYGEISSAEDEWEMVRSDGCDGLEMEGIRWAVDLGMWVACLAVGLLVSKASAMGLRRIKSLQDVSSFFLK
ncbi:Uncharacterized protein AXF42_Ash012653 [Apostasia shenzhenica]|uniref:Uncharacterized protein n=1 Tax=Apostasia shenzhenica TaxID=1088818 RepID=A0A2H9ZT95_9ASPA|nr:Uncharacterized protein AXF42_Ash012653 [Apostasia shenzhenica]